ncbi:hypothetical protein [Methylobacter sp.]|uniref:hypothetical protein n=1 Tax=Methylobacter sp. TaxID=2051955 RepID=UPI003DA563B1
MANSTLQAIRTKIRRITGSLSANQVSDADIDEYVNTFIAYDFPEELRLFTLRVTLTWWCDPFIDEYNTDATASVPQLVNYNQNYITTHPPMYCAGYKLLYTQSREEFFNYWPFTNAIQMIASGDGVTTNFVGTLTSGVPVLRNNVTFASIDANNNGLEVHDDGLGNLVEGTNPAPVGTINYVTGAYNFTYSTPPGPSQQVNSETFPYTTGRPTTMLYYANKFTLRPVPNQPYPIIMEAYKRPTQLLQAGSSPELEQWWQYIAYGGALKLLQDQANYERAAEIMPEFHKQELLVLRRTTQQLSNERSMTIYTQQANIGGWNSPFGNGIY